MSTYINGSLLGTTTPGGVSVDNGAAYRIGRHFSNLSNYMTGEIGEVRIYGYALTSSEVLALYNTGSLLYTT
jgi:hypothetical protein